MTNKALTPNEQFKFTPTGLTIKGQPTIEDFEEAYNWLKFVEGAVHWWLGDLMQAGEEIHGEAIYQIVKSNDFAMGTARNDKWVAGAIPFSLRREELSYSHHVEVAHLEPPDQKYLLELAAQEQLTTRQLRQKVKALKMQNGNDNTDEYRRMINRCINIIDVLTDNYPAGIVEIQMYLEHNTVQKT